jgi:hypothetical protein
MDAIRQQYGMMIEQDTWEGVYGLYDVITRPLRDVLHRTITQTIQTIDPSRVPYGTGNPLIHPHPSDEPYLAESIWKRYQDG